MDGYTCSRREVYGGVVCLCMKCDDKRSCGAECLLDIGLADRSDSFLDELEADALVLELCEFVFYRFQSSGDISLDNE